MIELKRVPTKAPCFSLSLFIRLTKKGEEEEREHLLECDEEMLHTLNNTRGEFRFNTLIVTYQSKASNNVAERKEQSTRSTTDV